MEEKPTLTHCYIPLWVGLTNPWASISRPPIGNRKNVKPVSYSIPNGEPERMHTYTCVLKLYLFICI